MRLFTITPMHLPILGGPNISIMHNNDEPFYLKARWYYALVTDLIIEFVALHVTAAFYHLFIVRARIMQRIAIFWWSEPVEGLISQLNEGRNK